MAKQKEILEIKDLEFDSDGLYIQSGSEVSKLPVYSTGSLSLDVMLNGGFNPGFMQLWGPDGIGKTTLLLLMASQFQKAHNYEGVRVVVHCTEGRWNPRLLAMTPEIQMESASEKLSDGSPRPILLVSYPKTGEKMYDYILKTLKQDKIKFFHIVDSCDGIKSVVNEDKSMGDAEKTANIATLNTRFAKEASVYANHYGHVVAYTHQVRDKISTGPSHVSGVGKQRAGGHALDHYANLRLNFQKLWTDLFIREDPNDNKSKMLGHIMSVEIDKVSSSGNRSQKVPIPFIYNHGIDRIREIITLAVEGCGLVGKKGAWYVINDTNVAQGYNKFVTYLKDNPDVCNDLEKQIKQIYAI